MQAKTTGCDSRFDWKDFLKKLAVIAIPVALQNLLTTTGSMVDTMMIAGQGENAVGAVGLCGQFTSLMFSCYWGFVGGGMLFFAQYWGNRDEKGIERSYGITLLSMMTVAFIFCLLATVFPGFVMNIYTDKDAIKEIGIRYLKIVGFAYPLQVFSMAMSALLRSTGKVRVPLYASIASVAANIFLNWVLIDGHLGVKPLGVEGAAMATVCASFVNAALCLILARVQKYPFLFRWKGHFRWTAAWLKEYFRKCFPIICNELLVGVGNAVISTVLGRQDEQAIAAIAVFRVLEGLVIGFFAGFSNAASVLVGTCVGAGEPEKAYERAKRIVYLCCGTIFVLCGGIFLLRAPILTSMGLSGASFRYGEMLVLIYGIAAVIRMGNWTQNDTYRSAGDAFTGTVMEIVFMYAMVLPAVILSGRVFGASLMVVFICCYIDEPIRFVLMQRHMYSGKWIRPVTPEGKAAMPRFFEMLKGRRGEKDAGGLTQ